MDFDETWFLHSLSWNIHSISFSVICCMASELEPAEKSIFNQITANPWHLINHNFKHSQPFDMQFAPLVARKILFHLVWLSSISNKGQVKHHH